MNYEQKCNEVLQKAKEEYNRLGELGNESMKRRFEIIFPELAESDDERIRKTLIEELSACNTVGELKFRLPAPTREECIAYLEKQKEQPKEELVYRLNGLMQDYIKEGKDEEEREHRLKCYQLFWDALEDTEFFQQKEQNGIPSRETILGIWELGNIWKENPEARDGLTQLQYIQKYWNEKCDYKKDQKPAECIPNSIKFDEGFKTGREVGFREGVESVKPAEWSEDIRDEFTRNIRNLITDKLTVHTKGLDGSEISSTVFIDDKTAKDIASGVLFYVGKEATKNPNREISEWSEEDKDKLEQCIRIVSGWEGDYDIVKSPYSNFLKSLRLDSYKNCNGHWKPSEEQICVLCDAISALKHFGYKPVEIVESLCEQLKKLI